MANDHECTKVTGDSLLKMPVAQKENVKIKIYGSIIPITTQATYLGVVFDTKLSWEQQICTMTAKAYARLNLLRAIASLSKRHNATLLAQLYNSTI